MIAKMTERGYFFSDGAMNFFLDIEAIRRKMFYKANMLDGFGCGSSSSVGEDVEERRRRNGMNLLKNAWAIGIAGALSLVVSPARSWAADAPPLAVTVTATIQSTANLSVERDPGNSDDVGTPTSIVFNRLDSGDGQADGNTGFMYAPWRSKVNKNYHLIRMFSNGATLRDSRPRGLRWTATMWLGVIW